MNLSEKQALQAYIVETALKIEEARDTYDLLINQAAKYKERKKTDLEQPSLDTQQYLPNHIYPNSAYRQEMQVQFVLLRFWGRKSYGDMDKV